MALEAPVAMSTLVMKIVMVCSPQQPPCRLIKVSGHGMIVFKQAWIIELVGSSSFNLRQSTTKRQEKPAMPQACPSMSGNS